MNAEVDSGTQTEYVVVGPGDGPEKSNLVEVLITVSPSALVENLDWPDGPELGVLDGSFGIHLHPELAFSFMESVLVLARILLQQDEHNPAPRAVECRL